MKFEACTSCGAPDVDDSLDEDGLCYACSQPDDIGEGVFTGTHARQLMDSVARSLAEKTDEFGVATVKSRILDAAKDLKKEGKA